MGDESARQEVTLDRLRNNQQSGATPLCYNGVLVAVSVALFCNWWKLGLTLAQDKRRREE